MRQDLIYELFSISVHIGSINFGHYVSFTKRDIDVDQEGKTHSKQQWFLFDDEDITMCSEKQILEQEAYLLFYRLKQDR